MKSMWRINEAQTVLEMNESIRRLGSVDLAH